jgi:hypothetical protein
VRACTRSPERFSPLSCAAPCPTERSTASASAARIALYSSSTCSGFNQPAAAYGEMRAVCRISSL